MNWVDIKYIFEQIKNGKVVSKKASSLTDDWITLQLTPSTINGRYDHQGIEHGIYLVEMAWQGSSGGAMFFYSMIGYAKFAQYAGSEGAVQLALRENDLDAFVETESGRQPMKNLSMRVKKIL